VELARQAYSPWTNIAHLQLMEHVSRWLAVHRLEAVGLTEASIRRAQLAALSGPDGRARLLEFFGDHAGPAIDLINASPDIMAMSPIHTLAHLPAWHRNRMIVIGDAAHAPSPTSGQGASLSVEDAVVLAPKPA
jgi:2-polyprenyl-6-methoxyphenol hydroxylase-like FAD-dependent oxidoreductase